METFGQRLSRIRKERNLTQQEIADRFNISAQAVSKWENDITSPDLDSLVILSEMLQVSVDELLGKEKKEATYIPLEKRKDINKLMFKIVINGSEGDKVRINIPLAVVKILLSSNNENKIISGNKALEGIDFQQLIALVEQGVIGEIVSIDTADGDHVRIVVE